MKNTKVVYALSSLNIYELNAFSKFIHSVYFNAHEQLALLADLYIFHIKEGSLVEMDKSSAWSHISDEDYDDEKFRKLNSELLKKVQQFIGQREYEAKDFDPSIDILEGIVSRDLVRLYKVSSSATLRDIERSYNKASEYYQSAFTYQEIIYRIQLQTERDRSRFKDLLSIDKTSEHLDTYYLSEKLRLYAVLLTWKRLYKVDKKIDYIEVLMKLARSEKYEDVAPIQVYLSIIQMSLEPENTDHFYTYKDHVARFIHHFPKEEINEIYEAGFNFCVARVNVGDSTFQTETLELYKEALENNAIIKDDAMSSAAFNNIVFFALREGQYDWAEKFIHNYATYLDEEIKDSMVALGLARVEFYKKNYEQVIQHLIDVEYSSVVIALSSKVILLFSYFELDEIDPLDSLINSFRAYINREKSISPKRKKSYSNLLNFTKKISRINPNDEEKIAALKAKLLETDNVASKPWLLEKIEELG